MGRQCLNGWMPALMTATIVVIVAASGCAEQPLPGRPEWTLAEHEANRSCQAGSAAACGELGWRLWERDSATYKDRERALVLLEMACGQDQVLACAVLGGAYGDKYGQDPRGAARAAELLGRACDWKLAPACTAMGALALVRERPPSEAAAFFRTGCELGDADGCERFGLVVSQGPLGGDAAGAEAAFAKACELGRPSACHRLANLWLRDPARHDEGLRRLTEACHRGQVVSCLDLALETAPLVSAHADCKQAAPFAAAACRGKEADGCAIAAACRLPDTAAATDALAELRRGCDASQPLSCLYWADTQTKTATAAQLKGAYTAACRNDSPAAPLGCTRMVLQTLATTQVGYEAERMLGHLRVLCNRLVGPACCALAGEHETGRWTPADAGRAAELRAQACTLGEQSCCARGTPPSPGK